MRGTQTRMAAVGSGRAALLAVAFAGLAGLAVAAASAGRPKREPRPALEVVEGLDTDDPGMRLLLPLVAAVPSNMTVNEADRDLPVGNHEVREALEAALRGADANVVMIEKAVKRVTPAKAVTYEVLCTVYLREANVVRRVVIGVTRTPAGATLVTSLRSAQSSAPDDSVSAAPATQEFARFEQAATYDG